MQQRLRGISWWSCLLGFLVLIGSSIISPLEAANKKEKKGKKTFEETAQVVLIEVPVNVVSKDGQPVRGLTAEDFNLLDNGVPQEIVGIEEVDLSASRPSRQELPRELERLPAVARRHFLLLFDLSFSTPTAIIRAREAAYRFVLESLHPTDLAAVATFSLEQGPQLLITFTPDRAQLSRAIDTLGVPELLSKKRVVDPLRFVIEDPIYASAAGTDRLSSSAGGGGTAPGALYDAFLQVIAKQADKAQKSYERRRVSSWSRSLGEMARALSTLKGRKHVVYFSEGFDGRLLLGRDPDPTNTEAIRDQINIDQGQLWMVDNDDRFGNSSLMTAVDNMLEEFRRSDSVIQAVDIGGLRAEGSVAADNRGSSGVSSVGQDALFYVAHETGGELFEDANDLSTQLSDLLDHTSVTYVLSFYPSDLKLDGKYHKLKVKTDLPRGTRLSHRPGYYAPRGFKDLHPLEKALLASEAIASAAPRKEIGIQVLAAPFRASEDLAYVPVIIEVEGESLLTEHEGQELGVEIYTYATNDQGEMRDFFSQVVQLNLGQGRKMISATGIKYYGHLELGPGDHLVRVLIRNNETGRVGVESLRVEVPPYEQQQPDLLPPFFVERPGRWLLVREKTEEGRVESVVYPFTVNGEPYIPSARPELYANRSSRFCLVAYNLGEGELELSGQVLNAEGAPLEGGKLALVERTITGREGIDKVLASFEPVGIQQGEYTLEVSLTNVATGSTQMNSIPFIVN